MLMNLAVLMCVCMSSYGNVPNTNSNIAVFGMKNMNTVKLVRKIEELLKQSTGSIDSKLEEIKKKMQKILEELKSGKLSQSEKEAKESAFMEEQRRMISLRESFQDKVNEIRKTSADAVMSALSKSAEKIVQKGKTNIVLPDAAVLASSKTGGSSDPSEPSKS